MHRVGTRRRRVRPIPRSRHRRAPTFYTPSQLSGFPMLPPLSSDCSFSGPGSRPSGPGFRCSGAGTGSGPAPVPEPEDPYQAPDCRDPRPEDVSLPLTFAPLHRSSAPICTFALSHVLQPSGPRVLAASPFSPVSPCPRAPSGKSTVTKFN